ncbi:MAG: type II toxin-antitoxin system PemK/MazF family toxin [Chloroflexota bacterium]
MQVNQGEVYWVMLPEADGLGAAIAHPQVIIQADVINHSRIQSVVVVALTTNPKRVNEPGNVLLEVGEANLPKASIVVVSQVTNVAKADLGAYIGQLSAQRVEQILAGMRFLQQISAGRETDE